MISSILFSFLSIPRKNYFPFNNNNNMKKKKKWKKKKKCTGYSDLGKMKFEVSAKLTQVHAKFGNSKIQIIKSQKPIHKIPNTPSYHFHNNI